MKLKNPIQDMRTIKGLLTGAEDIARGAGESQPGAEHLLLSALEMPEGSARRSFERIGADPHAFGPAVAAQHAEALRAMGLEPPDEEALAPGRGPGPKPSRWYRANASLQSAFQRAGELARDDGTWMNGAHVVVAVAGMEHGTAARALRAMGVDREQLAAAAATEARAAPKR
jgi:ATP-dependent Clp protease ATP-binding subunit ClpA